MFGETVMVPKLVQYKGNNTFHRGICVGKKQWNDAYLILTPEGAFEARTVRGHGDCKRLTVELFPTGHHDETWRPNPKRYRQPMSETDAT